MRKKIDPNMAKNVSVIAALAPEKRGLANRRMSSIGSRVRSSQAMKAPRMATAAAKAARIVGFVQPFDGASMIAHTSVVRPEIDMAKPGMSSRGAAGSLDSGTSQWPASSAAATNGRLTRKTAFQLACSISQPPATGPMAMPRPDTPAHTPIAFARSSAGKTAVMIDSVEGMMKAPPTPIRARVAISIAGEVASAERPEPRPKTARPKRERPLAAEAVAESTRGEQQAGEDEHVRVDDPLQLGAGCAEVVLQRGERDVEDGVVEPDDEQRRGEDDEGPPALRHDGLLGGREKRDGFVSHGSAKVQQSIAKRNGTVP